jgi:anti-sigma factor RsiW
MNCNRTRELLPAHVDQELSVPETIELEQHLQGCPTCRQELAQQSEVRTAMKKHATYYKAPAHLEARIKAALPQEPTRPKRWLRWTWSPRWLNAGAAFATVFALASSMTLYLSVPSANELLADDVISSHVRSLMVNHLADVASSDQHTVKPWFNGKLDFSPTVTDFTAEGFPLVGGRLDYLDRRPVAALVYRHRLHLINVYEWPAASEEPEAIRTLSRQGYHLVHWVEGGMRYWVVSDLDPRELMSLVHILQAQGKPPAVSPPGPEDKG